MPRNKSEFGEVAITPLSGQLDLRSPSGRLGFGDFRLILNASMNEMGKRCRRFGWKRLMADSSRGFNNQDLHDQLVGAYTGVLIDLPPCVEPPNNCACPPQSPACVEIVDFTEAMFEDCEAGQVSPMPAWNGVIDGTTSCSWGFGFNQLSLNGRSLAVRLAFKTCPPEAYDDRWVLTVLGRTEDETQAIIVWQGERSGSVLGTYHRAVGCSALPTLELVNCTACAKPQVTIEPPDGAHVVPGTVIFLHAPAGAVIYYTTDGGDPDDTSTLYDGPFVLPDGATVVKAIAYTTGCVSDIAEAVYVIETDFLFQYLCQPGEDKAGAFFDFGPNGNPDDYKWRLRFGFDEVVDVKRLELYETDTGGVWVTGQAWATDNPIFPVELGGAEFAVYPLVIKEGGSDVNTQYETTLVENLTVGLHNWLMYGQPFVPLTGYFKLIFVYIDENGDEQKIYSIISNQCECYDDYGGSYGGYDGYGEYGGYEDYYSCYGGDGEPIHPVSNGLINVDLYAAGGAPKTGAAAVGLPGDYWNQYNVPIGSVAQVNAEPLQLAWANVDDSSVFLSTYVHGGSLSTDIVWQAAIQNTGHPDPMMATTAVSSPTGVPSGLVIQNLPDGVYDVYVYGHGQLPGDILRVFLLTPFQTPPESLRPEQATINGTEWESATWTEGHQYVVFRDVSFATLEANDIAILFPHQDPTLGQFDEFYISGIQIVKKS